MSDPKATPVLEIDALTIRFGGLTAVKDVSFAVRPGEIYSVIGPNGAGKTTVFNAVTGIYEPTSGHVRFQGKSVSEPWSWKVLLAASLVALTTGLAAAVLTVNVNHLWKAAVIRPWQIAIAAPKVDGKSTRPFSLSHIPAGALAYLRNSPTIEPGFRGRWKVVAADGTELDKTPTDFDAASKKAQTFAEQGTPTGGRTAWFLLGLLAGAGLGFAGTLAVWWRARRTTDVICRHGIARTFQNIRLFQNMTALENVAVGMDERFSRGLLGAVLRPPFFRRNERECVAKAKGLLEFVGLGGSEVESNLAKNLPYGDQRRLEIARALATDPELVLLDEPAAGMNPAESEDLMELIRKIRDAGVTVLLIEHHMRLVMGISDRIAVLEYGRKIAEGTPEEVRKNPKVIAAYLGQEEVA